MSQLEDLSIYLGEIIKQCENLKLKQDNLSTSKGIELLRYKNDVFISYLKNLLYLLLLKSEGKSIANHPAVQRIVEYRLTLEKIRPIEQKLKIQIDRAVNLAIQDNDAGIEDEGLNARLMDMEADDSAESDFSADEVEEENKSGSDNEKEDSDENIDSGGSEDVDEDNSDAEIKGDNTDESINSDDVAGEDGESVNSYDVVGEDGESVNSNDIEPAKLQQPRYPVKKAKGASSGIYKPAKINPVFYVDPKETARNEREMQRARKRAIRSTLLEDIQDDTGDQPREVHESASNLDRVELHKAKERQRYEEENFMRVQLTKKERSNQRALVRGDPIAKIGNFGEIKSLLNDDEYPELQFRKNAGRTKKEKKRLKKGKKNKFKKGRRK